MERKHIAEEIHFDLKELFEICEEVICKESEYREDESSRGVLRLAKALIRNTSYSDGNHFDEEEQLYELADEYLSDFYDRNGIEELYEIDDAEYQERAQALFFCLQCDSADNRTLFVRQKRKRKRGQNVFDERINVYT